MFDRGTVIGGWTVDELLHQGSMATTFRVQREGVPSPHVLKLLFLRDPAFQERLRRAADVLITVRHPNLVSVVELVEHEGMQGIVSRFVEGTDLATWSATEQRPLTAVIKVFRQLTQGLRAAHDHGLVHRNLKPAKVLIDLTGRPHVHDFMLGKVLATSPEDAVTQLGTTFGTPQYMAPEQFRGAAGVDERADLFSLGCLLFELVAGRRAFEGQGLMEIYQNVSQGVRDDLTTVRSDVPPALERLVRDLTAPDPADRPDSARAVIDRLSEPELRALLSPSFSTATPVAALTTEHPSTPPASQPATAPLRAPEPAVRVMASTPPPHSHAPPLDAHAAVPILSDDEQVRLGAPRGPLHTPSPAARQDGPLMQDLSEPSAPSIIAFTQFDSAESEPAVDDTAGRFHETSPPPGITPVQLTMLLSAVFLVALLVGMWFAM